MKCEKCVDELFFIIYLNFLEQITNIDVKTIDSFVVSYRCLALARTKNLVTLNSKNKKRKQYSGFLTSFTCHRRSKKPEYNLTLPWCNRLENNVGVFISFKDATNRRFLSRKNRNNQRRYPVFLA